MSYSRSSSSSVRNKSQFQNEYRGVNYHCNLPAPCHEAWKQGTLDPGRRFLVVAITKILPENATFFYGLMNHTPKELEM